MNRSTSNALKILSRLLARDFVQTYRPSSSVSRKLFDQTDREPIFQSQNSASRTLSVLPCSSGFPLITRSFASSSALADESAEEPVVYLSASCVKRMKKLQSEEPDSDVLLRVAVEGGGCSGFQYTFTLDHKINEDDRMIHADVETKIVVYRVYEKDGAKLVVDETSLEYLKGSTVEYSEELIRSAFRVAANPKAEHGCSCGSSFSVKI